MGRKHGISERQLQELGRYQQSESFTALEKLVIDYAVAMTGTPADIPDRVYNELRRHFDEAQIVELTAAISWENHRARFNHAFGLKAQGFSKGAYCPLPERVGGA